MRSQKEVERAGEVVTDAFRGAHLHRINRSPVPFAELSGGNGVLLLEARTVLMCARHPVHFGDRRAAPGRDLFLDVDRSHLDASLGARDAACLVLMLPLGKRSERSRIGLSLHPVQRRTGLVQLKVRKCNENAFPTTEPLDTPHPPA